MFGVPGPACAFAQAGFDLVLTDTDVIWFKDPVAILKQYSQVGRPCLHCCVKSLNLAIAAQLHGIICTATLLNSGILGQVRAMHCMPSKVPASCLLP